MKKFFPLVLAILSIGIFLTIIMRNEIHLNNSDSIFIKLQPVDPRSLIQGDYMILSYELFWDENSLNQDKVIKNKNNIQAYVQLDRQRHVIATSLTAKFPQALMLKNPDNRVQRLYPTSNSFLFAEGLAKCYERASYAEFRTNQAGKSILTSLRDDNLKSLNCENQKTWWQGFMQTTSS